MRNLLAILLLLIFTCQVIPLRVLDKMFSKYQNTEEVQQDDDCEDGDVFKITKVGCDHILPYHPDFTMCASRFGNRVSTIIHVNESLPLQHVTDVFSPPPDTNTIL